MSIFVITYEYNGDSAGRADHLEAHKAFLGDLDEKSVLLAAGVLTGDAPGAMLFAEGSSVEEVSDVFASDPFQTNGLVETLSVRQWNPTRGRAAAYFTS